MLENQFIYSNPEGRKFIKISLKYSCKKNPRMVGNPGDFRKYLYSVI